MVYTGKFFLDTSTTPAYLSLNEKKKYNYGQI